jgi:hypothetical protein
VEDLFGVSRGDAGLRGDSHGVEVSMVKSKEADGLVMCRGLS